MKGNLESKLIVLSHDVYSVIQLNKLVDDINNELKKVSGNRKFKVGTFELKNKNLENLNPKSFNEMSKLLTNVALYAFGNERKFGHYSENVGNMLRRILEGYSTFNYTMGIEQLSNDSKIMGRIGPDRQEYYQNLMYRFLLNGESHLQEKKLKLIHLWIQ